MEWWAYKIWDESVLAMQKLWDIVFTIIVMAVMFGIGCGFLWYIAQRALSA